ncbi:MAG: 5'/3'-nucleotidase SurE [Armatimonadota bacterium]|nr:5'/3'-nucleotidase SurE [Armatimonadota bacterium]MDR5696816.1 5'/3'-nucleotidase SurE [Armatimonadota bacterium]
MHILVTNDDGIQSEGLHALVRALETVGIVHVVAPHHERSASGHAITLHKPLRAFAVEIPESRAAAWATTGTPADCVVLAVYDLLPQRPDLVLSGINVGANIGHDLTYSGTVSGAMEAAIMGIPAIAVSVDALDEARFDVAASFAAALVQQVCRHGMQEDTLLNVNVPNRPADQIRGVALTRQSAGRYINRLERREDPRGRPYYWLLGERATGQAPEGTDSHALAAGYISVTPVQMNMTNESMRLAMQAWELDRLLTRGVRSRRS